MARRRGVRHLQQDCSSTFSAPASAPVLGHQLMQVGERGFFELTGAGSADAQCLALIELGDVLRERGM